MSKSTLAALCLSVVTTAWGLSAPTAFGQTVPSGFSVTTVISTGLTSPTCFCFAPDGRIFIGQKGGGIRVWTPSAGLLTTPFFSIPVNAGGEMGLLGITLDPDFSHNQNIYVHYTRSGSPSSATIGRLTASTADPNVADASGVTVLFNAGNSPTGIHNAGCIRFGPDGKLYTTIGENANGSNSQSVANLLGKILRLNPDGSIPDDNPTTFAGVAAAPTGNNRAIWALGLRNPFRFTFQPGTGRLFINDVGAGFAEEVNEGIAGRNYGWPSTEGNFNPATYPNFTLPLVQGLRTSTAPLYSAVFTGCAFYNPKVCSYPIEYYGQYFWGDYGRSWVKRMNPDTHVVTDFGASVGNTTDLQVDDLGRLFVLTLSNKLLRIDNTLPFAPSLISSPPAQQATCAGRTVVLTAVPAGSLPLTLQWLFNGQPLADGGRISGATTPTLTISGVRSSDAGDYVLLVHNGSGDAATPPTTLSVTTPGDGRDIATFVESVLAGSAAPEVVCKFDFSADGLIDSNDTPGLVNALLTP